MEFLKLIETPSDSSLPLPSLSSFIEEPFLGYGVVPPARLTNLDSVAFLSAEFMFDMKKLFVLSVSSKI